MQINPLQIGRPARPLRAAAEKAMTINAIELDPKNDTPPAPTEVQGRVEEKKKLDLGPITRPATAD